MDKLALALGPAFAAGLALQRLLELIDPIVEALAGAQKKVLISLIAISAGVALALGADLGVLRNLGGEAPRWVDIAITALIVSAGTEGFNSLMKFLGYAKEAKKDTASASRTVTNADAGITIESQRLQRTVG